MRFIRTRDGTPTRDTEEVFSGNVTIAVRYDQGALREIRARVDIASFIGQYVPLRKRGNDLVGLCPFHGEKTPSFHVHPDRGFFKCFGCGAGGDVITFVQRLENASFGDAVRMLAAKAGVELEPENPRAARVAQRARGDLRSQSHRGRLLRADARERCAASLPAPTARSAVSAMRRSSASRWATRPIRGAGWSPNWSATASSWRSPRAPASSSRASAATTTSIATG